MRNVDFLRFTSRDQLILIRHRQKLPTLEHLFARLCTHTGLFVVGAGASAGSSPLGRDFWRAAPLDYLRDLRSFSAVVTPRAPLTQRMIGQSAIQIEDIIRNHSFNPDNDDRLLREILLRLPDAFARLHLMHALARARYLAQTDGVVTDSYRVFRKFYPSVIADYNHDGLAREFSGVRHSIVEMHGTIHPAYGSPEFGAWISTLREFDIASRPDDLVMGLPESWSDARLYRRLSWVMSREPQHVAIIGYSFAQMGSGYDDAVTLACFVQRFKHYPGAIFVISPDPTHLCDMLVDALEINTVYPIQRYWNVLAHAYLETQRNPDAFRSLDHAHGILYDRYGSARAFPILPHCV